MIEPKSLVAVLGAATAFITATTELLKEIWKIRKESLSIKK
jgi:hypothetical protein